MDTSFITRTTLAAVALLTLTLGGAVEAKPASTPGPKMEESVITYPEADVQRYVVTYPGGQAGSFFPSSFEGHGFNEAATENLSSKLEPATAEPGEAEAVENERKAEKTSKKSSRRRR